MIIRNDLHAVEIKNLSVTLGGVGALRDVTVEVFTGKITALIGPSGAGKTTLIRAIVGRLKISSGAVSVLGCPSGSAMLRSEVAYMSQDLSIYEDLTVRNNLKYFATMIGIPRKGLTQLVDDTLREVDLLDKAQSLVENLSGGQKRRVSLAVALLGSPKLLVLDEPTAELDPVLRDQLWRLFAKLAATGKTLIISSHSMDEASRCDDLVLIRDGEVIAHSTPRELLQRTGEPTVERAFLHVVTEAKR